jgi:hypothetical protein
VKRTVATIGAGLFLVWALAPAVEAHADPDYDGAANVACQYSLAHDSVYPNPLFLVDYHGFSYEEARRFVIDAFRSAHERNGGYIAPEMKRNTCDGIELSENY